MTAATRLSRDEIRSRVLSADDRATEEVEVPEWGVTLTVQALSGTMRDKYQNGLIEYGRDAKGLPTISGYNPVGADARLVALSVVDDAGAAVFSEADVLDLGDRSPVAIDRVVSVAKRLSGLTNNAVEVARAGLEPGQNGSSGSD